MPADGGDQQLAEPCWDTRIDMDGGVFDAVEAALLNDALSGD